MEKFIWEGRELRSMGDTMEAVLTIAEAGDAEKAAAFVKAYERISVYARQNIGFGAGYYDRETAEKIFDLFETSHPIFGRHWPTSEEAFEMGKRMAGGGRP